LTFEGNLTILLGLEMVMLDICSLTVDCIKLLLCLCRCTGECRCSCLDC